MSGRVIGMIVVAMVALGCGGGGGGGSASGPCGDLNLKVFGGEQCKYQRSPVVAIVGFSVSGIPIGVCSATMVTVNDALTAAHCVELTEAPGGVAVFADGEFHPIVGGVNHPLYNGSVGSPYDVAMITIGSVLDIGPVPIVLSNALEVGESVTVFGYGKNEDSISIPQARDFKAGYMRVGAVDGAQFVAAFDDTQSAVCFGDSGGPATQVIDGVTGLVGVSSFAVNGCQSGSISGFVDVQNPAIFDFILGYAPDVAVR